MNASTDLINQLTKILDAAVYRMSACPLACALRSAFPSRDNKFEAAKQRYIIFASWCARRATIALTRGHRDESMVLDLMDALIQEQFEQLFGRSDNDLDLVAEAFKRFDEALNNKTLLPWHSESEATAAVYSLNRTATSFIFSGNFDASFSNPDDAENWAKTLVLPGIVLVEIHTAAKSILAALGRPGL